MKVSRLIQVESNVVLKHKKRKKTHNTAKLRIVVKLVLEAARLVLVFGEMKRMINFYHSVQVMSKPQLLLNKGTN